MKKWVSMILIAILSLCLVSTAFSEEKVLIDFSLLKANSVDGTTGADSKNPPLTKDNQEYVKYDDHTSTVNNVEVPRRQHIPTILDYSGVVGSNFNEADKKAMRISLANPNWVVDLNSSAAHNENIAKSYCVEWHTKVNASSILHDVVKNPDGTVNTQAAKPEGYTILGIRVKFPESTYNCYAVVAPPYEIPAYENIFIDFIGNAVADPKAKENIGTKYENGYGVIKNVGVIKKIKMRIYGLQFKNSISVVLKDDSSKETEYHFPEYLDFDGWKELAWNNPNYIESAANRDIYIVPLYPKTMPYVKLSNFVIYRQGDQWGGDFVTYIKDIKIVYDLAVLETDREIDHESAWGILEARTKEAKERELFRIGDSQLMQYIERQKMHKESSQ